MTNERRPLQPISNSTLNTGNKETNGVHPTKKTTTYRRKDKSLGLLCENVMWRYGGTEDMARPLSQSHMEGNHVEEKISSEKCISIDAAADDLGVERRRIYDIINILESIQIVSRKCKNTYNWHGTKHLPCILSKLQRVASQLWKEESSANGITKAIEEHRDCTMEEDLEAAEEELQRQRLKSLGKLSQEFLQVFLVVNDIVNLNEATEKIVEGGSEENKGKSENEKEKSSTPFIVIIPNNT